MARVAVIGSVAEDEVLTLPGPLRAGSHVDARRRERRLGGGGANTAIPLARAGHEVLIVAPLGTDERGDWLLGQLGEAGVDTSLVVRSGGESTRSVVLVDPGGERTIVNVHRCREDGSPRRLEGIELDALYVRSREPELVELMAKFVGHAIVVAHVPPLARASRPAHVLVDAWVPSRLWRRRTSQASATIDSPAGQEQRPGTAFPAHIGTMGSPIGSPTM